MGLNEIRLGDSVTVQLLRRIFGIYCLIAIAMTAAQMWNEYQHSRDRVVQVMGAYQSVVGQGLANAIWQLDLDLLEALLEGITENELISGVSIFEANGRLLTQGGLVAARERTLTPETTLMGLQASPTVGYIEAPLEHRFELMNPAQPTAPLAHVIFYSSPAVVLDQVKSAFGTLLLAALVKTLALWLLFLYFGQRLLRRPLGAMLATVRGLPLEVPDDDPHRPRQGMNELELLDTALQGMADKLNSTLQALHQANDALANTNRHLQRATDQSPTLSCVFDRRGDPVYVSPSFTDLTGYSAGEAARVYHQQLHGDPALSTLLSQFEQDALESWQAERPLEDRQGQRLWLTVTLSPVRDETGAITHLLSSASDITALKALEQSLQQKTEEQTRTIARLEQAHNQLLQSEKMASIGSLAAGIAHEINNPIGYVNANLSSLRHYIDELMTVLSLYEAQQQRIPALMEAVRGPLAATDLDFIRDDIYSLMDESSEGIERVKQIIRDLMDFSRADPEKWTYSDLRKGLESTLNVVWNELKYKAQVVREFEEIPEIECMPAQLNQVFMNLLVNAAHAIDDRGTITLRTRASDSHVQIDVEDTGCGIAPEHLGRLFDPFFTTKAVGKGTGLGLSVSYGIVKKHGGRIDVQSTPGRGSRFTLSLPIQQTDRKAA